jgi:hypothetical protein
VYVYLSRILAGSSRLNFRRYIDFRYYFFMRLLKEGGHMTPVEFLIRKGHANLATYAW